MGATIHPQMVRQLIQINKFSVKGLKIKIPKTLSLKLFLIIQLLEPVETHDSSRRSSGTGLRRSSSIQRIVQRLDNNTYQPPSHALSRGFSSHSLYQDETEQANNSSCEVFENPYRTINHVRFAAIKQIIIIIAS